MNFCMAGALTEALTDPDVEITLTDYSSDQTAAERRRTGPCPRQSVPPAVSPAQCPRQ